jgi:hypothetical protein
MQQIEQEGFDRINEISFQKRKAGRNGCEATAGLSKQERRKISSATYHNHSSLVRAPPQLTRERGHPASFPKPSVAIRVRGAAQQREAGLSIRG